MIRAAFALALAALPAAAQDRLPAPDYFIASAFETSTAQALAVSCQALSVDLGAMARRTEAALAQLTEDGFTPDNLVARMEDPSEAIGQLQSAFMQKHGLAEGADEAAVCAAGRTEIAEDTAIGALLLEVEP